MGGITAGAMAVLSALGLLFPDSFYPTQELAEAFLTNDLVNLLLGLPLFLLALTGLGKKKLSGLLLLPGALIYVIYNYFAYLLGIPLGAVSVFYLGLVLSAGTGLVLLLGAVDHQLVKTRLAGGVLDRISGGILLLFGLAFIGLAVSQLSTGIQEGKIPPLGENAVAVADIVVSLAWAAGGFLLLRRRPLGYSTALGLLAAASALFLGLILYFFLAPALVGRGFNWSEVLTVAVMGLIVFIPTGLFWRKTSRPSAP